jgi:hypothetical protein
MCNNDVSSNAQTCPHCGEPLKSSVIREIADKAKAFTSQGVSVAHQKFEKVGGLDGLKSKGLKTWGDIKAKAKDLYKKGDQPQSTATTSSDNSNQSEDAPDIPADEGKQPQSTTTTSSDNSNQSEDAPDIPADEGKQPQFTTTTSSDNSNQSECSADVPACESNQPLAVPVQEVEKPLKSVASDKQDAAITSQ